MEGHSYKEWPSAFDVLLNDESLVAKCLVLHATLIDDIACSVLSLSSLSAKETKGCVGRTVSVRYGLSNNPPVADAQQRKVVTYNDNSLLGLIFGSRF